MSEESSSLVLRPDPGDVGQRLDAFLSEKVDGWSRSRLRRLIDDSDVLVNGTGSKASYRIRENDEIEVELTEPPVARFEPENIPLDIVYEDDSLAVINKPARMVVHPGAGINSGTLANAIAWHFLSEPPASVRGQFDASDATERTNWPPPHGGSSDRIGIVHRLDKDTSGLIVVAKNEETHEALAEQFQKREVEKSYVALVHGATRENSGKIERPIARDRRNRLKMAISETGRNALTLWRVRQRFEKLTLLDVEIKTGRTHQIRVHLASINHPVVGDALYNEGRDNTTSDTSVRLAIKDLNRFFLHAEKLGFTHPKSGERLEFSANLPNELTSFLKVLT
ncbi:MAG TPA: RluA family pseudouridine synthase [Pyrinomonadaceae bacterium]